MALGKVTDDHAVFDQEAMHHLAEKLRWYLERGRANHSYKRLVYGDARNNRSLVPPQVWDVFYAGAVAADGWTVVAWWLVERMAEELDENQDAFLAHARALDARTRYRALATSVAK